MSQKRKAIIVDIDGTLANVEHRVKYVQNTPKDWEAFHSSLHDDSVQDWCLELMEAMKGRGFALILLTGRGEEYHAATLSWLEKHSVPYDELYMRPQATRESDHLVKESIYQEFIEPEYDVLFVVEDRKSVVKMWRDLGLPCLHCDWGNF